MGGPWACGFIARTWSGGCRPHIRCSRSCGAYRFIYLPICGQREPIEFGSSSMYSAAVGAAPVSRSELARNASWIGWHMCPTPVQ